jgi:hypothetical protein
MSGGSDFTMGAMMELLQKEPLTQEDIDVFIAHIGFDTDDDSKETEELRECLIPHGKILGYFQISMLTGKIHSRLGDKHFETFMHLAICKWYHMVNKIRPIVCDPEDEDKNYGQWTSEQETQL